MTTQTYQAASRHLLRQAHRELDVGDYRQASEKGWGAAAQAVKAVCEARGWKHRTHGDLQRAVRRIAREQDDLAVSMAFRSANLLHVNFYEDWENEEVVYEALEHVAVFVDLLDALP